MSALSPCFGEGCKPTFAFPKFHSYTLCSPDYIKCSSFKTLRGYSLRRIETATQRSELSLLTALSGKQRSLIPDGQPVVVEIVVTEMDAQPKRAEDTRSALKK